MALVADGRSELPRGEEHALCFQAKHRPTAHDTGQPPAPAASASLLWVKLVIKLVRATGPPAAARL